MIPYFGYARQDRKAKARDPISAKLVANMIVAAGADRVLTMDLHAAQIQGFFDIPVDNLLGNPIFVDYYGELFGAQAERWWSFLRTSVPCPAPALFAQKLGMSLAIVDKRRPKANSCEVMNIIGDVKGRDCILSTIWWTRPAASAMRPRPLLMWAAPTLSMPVHRMPCFPARRWSG